MRTLAITFIRGAALKLQPRFEFAVTAVKDARVAFTVEDHDGVAQVLQQRAIMRDQQQHAAESAATISLAAETNE